MADLIWEVFGSAAVGVGIELARLTKTGSACWWPGFFGDETADHGLVDLSRMFISIN